MIATLTMAMRDNLGRDHRMGESVEVVGEINETETERRLLKVLWADGSWQYLLPDDVKVVLQ